MEMIGKFFASFLSLLKGLTGLIFGEGNEEAAKKVGRALALAFVALCVFNTVAAVRKAKKEGRWH